VQPDINASGIITAEVQTEPVVQHLANQVAQLTPGIITAEALTESAISIDELQHLANQVEQLTHVINTMLQLPATPKHT
jgi:hypothetical protein